MRMLGVVMGALAVMTVSIEAAASEPSTIVIDAKDDAGHDIGDATVAVDGETVASSIDGHAIAVAVGAHTITVTHNGVTRTENIIAKEDETARQIHVTFSGGVVPRNDVPSAPEQDFHHSSGPFIVMGAGAAALVTGIILFAAAPKMPEDCDPSTAKCTGASDEQQASHHVDDRSIGAMVMVGGAATALGGFIWYLFDKPKPRTAMIAPWLSAGSGGVSATGSF